MTLNDLERHNSPYIVFFREFDSFVGRLCHMVEDRLIMSVKYCLPVPVFHFWQKLTHPAARSLYDSWPTCLTLQRQQPLGPTCHFFEVKTSGAKLFRSIEGVTELLLSQINCLVVKDYDVQTTSSDRGESWRWTCTHCSTHVL